MHGMAHPQADELPAFGIDDQSFHPMRDAVYGIGGIMRAFGGGGGGLWLKLKEKEKGEREKT